MADYGATGISYGPVMVLRFDPWALRGFRLSDELCASGGKNTTEGDPSQPSLCLAAFGKWRFRWTVLSGTRTIQVAVKQALNRTPYPSIVVRANPLIGVNADVTESSPAGAGWKAAGPLTITPTSDGAVWVELRNNLHAQVNGAPCYFDTESITTT